MRLEVVQIHNQLNLILHNTHFIDRKALRNALTAWRLREERTGVKAFCSARSVKIHLEGKKRPLTDVRQHFHRKSEKVFT